MSSRFSSQSTHQRQRLFANYDTARASSQSPGPSNRPGSNLGYPPNSSYTPPTGAFGAYPSASNGNLAGGYRAATPNSKGQYSDTVLSELESQNDDQVDGLFSKVQRLKDLTLAVGEEIRDSSKLATTMNDTFDNTSVQLKRTMTRMLRMAERTGVGWRVWLGFFAFVILLFWYVWLF